MEKQRGRADTERRRMKEVAILTHNNTQYEIREREKTSDNWQNVPAYDHCSIWLSKLDYSQKLKVTF